MLCLQAAVSHELPNGDVSLKQRSPHIFTSASKYVDDNLPDGTPEEYPDCTTEEHPDCTAEELPQSPKFHYYHPYAEPVINSVRVSSSNTHDVKGLRVRASQQSHVTLGSIINHDYFHAPPPSRSRPSYAPLQPQHPQPPYPGHFLTNTYAPPRPTTDGPSHHSPSSSLGVSESGTQGSFHPAVTSHLPSLPSSPYPAYVPIAHHAHAPSYPVYYDSYPPYGGYPYPYYYASNHQQPPRVAANEVVYEHSSTYGGGEISGVVIDAPNSYYKAGNVENYKYILPYPASSQGFGHDGQQQEPGQSGHDNYGGRSAAPHDPSYYGDNNPPARASDTPDPSSGHGGPPIEPDESDYDDDESDYDDDDGEGSAAPPYRGDTIPPGDDPSPHEKPQLPSQSPPNGDNSTNALHPDTDGAGHHNHDSHQHADQMDNNSGALLPTAAVNGDSNPVDNEGEHTMTKIGEAGSAHSVTSED